MEINGLNINYVSEDKAGSGDVLLILHGWGCDCEVYRALIDHLSARFRVVVPDLPGFGKSDEPVEPYDVAAYADFAAEFCLKLGLSDIVLFGHSLGGRIAIKMLSDENCPVTVKKVILTGAAGIKPKRTVKARLKTRIYKIGRMFIERFNPERVEEYRKKHGSPDYNAASPVMRQSLVKIVNEDLKSHLHKVKQETLLIWGSADDQTPLSDGRIMEKLMPNAGLAVMKNAGHYAFLQHPKLFLGILDSYLTE